MRIAVVMPVASGAAEQARALDTIESIQAWEPSVRWVGLVDDDPRRNLQATGATSLVHPLLKGRTEDRVAAATLAGLKWARDRTSADAVMKIDSDALVIAPFAERLGPLLSSSKVGAVGCFERTPGGQSRDFRPCGLAVLRGAVRDPAFAGTLAIAGARGYRLGENVLGAGVALPRHALSRLPLDDPARFRRTGIWDDPLLGVLLRRAGLELVGAADSLFGLAWRGLPDTPQNLLDRGFSLIHSVKNDERFPESEIREFFRDRRPARS